MPHKNVPARQHWQCAQAFAGTWWPRHCLVMSLWPGGPRDRTAVWACHLHERTAVIGPPTLVLPGHSVRTSAVTGGTPVSQQNGIIKSLSAPACNRDSVSGSWAEVIRLLGFNRTALELGAGLRRGIWRTGELWSIFRKPSQVWLEKKHPSLRCVTLSPPEQPALLFLLASNRWSSAPPPSPSPPPPPQARQAASGALAGSGEQQQLQLWGPQRY